jgi:predicted metal-dependent phosphoesterase TrpH
MKIELHSHTSRYSPCATDSPRKLIKRFVKCQYDAIFLTEHNRVWPEEELRDIRKKFPRMMIFPGVELSISEESSQQAQHLVVLGTNDPTYLAMRQPREILDRARQEGLLTILAHPFRWEGSARMIEEGLRPDALEFRTNNHTAEHGKKSQETAASLGIPLVNAGDTHCRDFINRFWIETQRDLTEARDIRQIVLEGAYQNRSASEL